MLGRWSGWRPGGAPEPSGRSERVLIADAERRAERIIGLVRLGIALLLTTFLFGAVSQEVPHGDAMLNRQLLIAVATMLAYAVLGVVSFVMSSRRLHQRWHLFFFSFLDVAFVIVSLRMALSNTEMSADYLVALPSIWLIPIVLAFGAMRYSPFLQLFTAVVLVSMLGPLFFLYDFDPEAGRNLPDGLSNFFSDPPNAMRLVMVAVTAGVIVLAVARARALLANALAEERRAVSLTRYLPSEVARLVTDLPSADLTRGRRQHVAVLFVDIRSFTARSEAMAPEDIAGFLSHFRGILIDAAERSGGVIDKFIGDGAMVIFGLPDPHPDDSARAVAFARAVFAGVADWSATLEEAGAPPVHIAIGIHSDEAFLGAIGDAARLEFTVLGDMVNVAARIGDAAKQSETGFLVSRAVVEEAKLGTLEAKPLDAVPIRGHSQPVDLFVVDPAA